MASTLIIRRAQHLTMAVEWDWERELRTRARDAESPTWLDLNSQRHLLSWVKATAEAASRPRRHARATRAQCSEYPSAI